MGDGTVKEFIEGRTHPADLILVFIFSIIALALVIGLPDGNIARIVFGIPLMILFPGYMLVSALWPKAGELQDNAFNGAKNEPSTRLAGLGVLERAALSFGLSIALLAFTGLALNYTPVGITFGSSVGTLAALIFILGSIAYYRRVRVPVGERFAINFCVGAPRLPSDASERFLAGAIVTCVVISGCALGYLLLTPSEFGKYTELYMLDGNRTTRDYPANLTVNQTATVYIGLTNHEYGSVTYTILAGLDGSNTTEFRNDWTAVFNITNGARIGRTVALGNGDCMEEPFSFRCGMPGQYKIVWQLYVNGAATEYEVHLRVNVVAAP
ncbi:MAG: DUF1616 domain-containing protein [Euryarchaeota archaeon]|nr:DUF1616 domain-containing protein [Euryarchaeota archaeon]